MNNIYDLIDKDNKENIKGFVLVGSNNSGKTYQIIDMFKELVGIQEDNQSKNEYEYEISTCLFLSKEMNTRGIIKDNIQSQFSPKTITLEDFKNDVRNDGIKIKIDFKNDTIQDTSLQEVIFNTIISKIDYYINLVKGLLEIDLLYCKDTNELLIEEQEGVDKEFYSLESNGYVFLIRMIVFLDNLLDSNIEWILIDEPDASLDTANKEQFINIIERIKNENKSNAKVIFSSHSSETLYSLPPNYVIYKLLNKKEYEKYYSQDFFSKAKLEEKLFDMKNGQIYISEAMKELLKIYKLRLEDESNIIDLDKYDYKTLSIKEKVIYNAVKKIGL